MRTHGPVSYTHLEDMMRSFDLRCEIIRRKKEQYGFTGLSASVGLRGIAEVAGSVMFYPEESSDYVQEYCMKLMIH